MPKICVEIELDTDTGQVSVGMEPPDEAAADEAKEHLQPAGSVEEALSVAKDLLSGQSGAQAQDAEAQMARGYSNAGGAMGPAQVSPQGPRG